MKLVRLILRCGCLLSLLALSACVTQQRINGPAIVRDANELSAWTAMGRIGVSGAAQSGSGGFTWRQQTESSDVQLRGPVGVGALQIKLQGAQLSIQSSDGAQYDADQAIAELETRLGAPVPVAQLRYWLVGIAAPNMQYQWSDGGNKTLEQNGWRIVYTEWAQRGELRLPVRFTLSRDQLRIVIVVQSWQLGPV